MVPPHAQRLLGDGAGRRRSRGLVDLLPLVPSFGDQLLGRLGLALQSGQPRSWETPEGDKRSVTELEADEVGASLKWATAKVERSSQRGNGDRSSGRQRQAERGGDFNEPTPF